MDYVLKSYKKLYVRVYACVCVSSEFTVHSTCGMADIIMKIQFGPLSI